MLEKPGTSCDREGCWPGGPGRSYKTVSARVQPDEPPTGSGTHGKEIGVACDRHVRIRRREIVGEGPLVARVCQ